MIYSEDIKQTLEYLRQGGVILYPTDTIWGLGCDATDEKSVDKIFTIKNRPQNKSMIILVDSVGMLQRYTTDVPEVAFELIEVTDGPLTLVLPARAGAIAPSVVSPDGYVGIRVCGDAFCATMIGRFGKPVVSTSANTSGKPSPALFSEVEEEIIARVDYTVKYRQDDTERSKPSPVIKIFPNGTIEILRK
jgi:L-threonylcarbamoyladenylate synthase